MDLTIGSADFNSALCWAWFHSVTRADLSLSISFACDSPCDCLSRYDLDTFMPVEGVCVR